MTKKTKSKRGQGRPQIDYSDKIPALVEKCPPPATVTQICEHLGVSNAKFYQWLKEEPSFSEVVTRVQSVADDAVESALYKRAIGYDFSEVSETTKSGTRGDEVSTSMTAKHIPPDTRAAQVWLATRRRQKWGNKMELEVKGDFFDQLRVAKEAIAIAAGEVIDGEFEEVD